MMLRLAASALTALLAAAPAAAPKPATAPATPAPAPTAPAASAAAGATISGKVSGPDGKPLAGAVVRAIPMAQRATGMMRGAPPDVPKAVVGKTDASGEFKLEGLTGSSFAVRAESKGLAPADADGIPAGARTQLRLKAGLPVYGRVLDLTSRRPVAGAAVSAIESDATRFGRDAAHTTTSADDGTFKIVDCAPGIVAVDAIAPGKARTTLDRVTVKPVPAGEEPKPDVNTLFLRPGGRLAGRVVGGDGKPVVDAIVTANPSDGKLIAMLKDARLAQRSDASGKFAFDGIVAGNKYNLRASKPGFAADEEGPFVIEAGSDRSDVEMKIDAGAQLTFRLVTADDAPVKDVDLRVQSQDGPRRRGLAFGAGDVDRDKINPQGDGKFLVKALEPGTFDVTLAPPDFGDIVKEGVKLKSGETVDLGTLRAKESKSVGGKITDATGQPVVGASVSGLWFDATTPHSRETKSGADGRYKISGLGDEPMRNLWVRAEGFAQGSKEGASPGDNAVDFVLEKTGSVVGKVELAAGGVPPAFRVQAFPEAKEGQERGGFRIVVRAGADEDKVFTDPSGNFRLDGVDPGTVTITALTDGKTPARKSGVVVGAEQVVDVGTLKLDDGRTLRGRVVAAKDEAPIAGATITVTQPSGFGRMMGSEPPAGAAISALDGHFEISGLETRTYAIDAGQPDYSPNSGRVDIPADHDPEDYVIHLSKGGTLTGTVRDAGHQPIANTGVLLVTPGRGDGPQNATTGMDGRYSFEKLTPGEYTVIRAPTGGGPLMLFGGMKQVAVREGETTVYDIDEASKISLTGRILRGGQPVPNASVFFSTPDPSGEAADLKQSRSDADGKYQIGLDKAGTYMAMVSLTGGGFFGGGRSAVSIEVPDQPNPVVDITMKAASISGHVTNGDGKPVSGAVVTAAPLGGSSTDRPRGLQDMSDPDGKYEIGGLTAGSYKLTVAAGGYRNAEVPQVAIANDDDTPSVDVKLDSGRTARGRVIDAGGNGISGAMVMAAPAGTVSTGRDALPTTSDVNGGFVITVPADGPIDLSAVAAGFPPARLVGVVPEDGTDLVLKAPRGARERITVLSADGKPVAGARVACRAVPDFLGSGFLNFLNSVPPTGADGGTVVTSLGPGSYELTVSLGTAKATKAFTLGEGADGADVVTLP